MFNRKPEPSAQDAQPSQFQQPGQYPQQGQYDPNQHGYPQGSFQQQPPQPKKKNFFMRHKILTALLALIVIIGLGSAIGGGSKDSDPKTASSSAPSGEAKNNNGGTELAKMGTPVQDGKFTFTVLDVQRGKTVVGESFMQEKAQGEFTIVKLSVKNTGDKPQTVFDSNQKAFSDAGQEYSPNTSASIAMPNNSNFFVKEINPGNSVTGYMVFDAPVGTKLTSIELHDSAFSGGVKASLK